MLYDLSKPLDVDRLHAKLKADLEAGSVVEYTRKTQRTPSQNRYLHFVLGVVALDTGNTLEYTKQEYFKRLVNADVFVIEKTDQYLGKVSVLRSTTDCTTEELSRAIDRFKRWAAENGIYIPDPEDSARLREVEIEMARASRWL